MHAILWSDLVDEVNYINNDSVDHSIHSLYSLLKSRLIIKLGKTIQQKKTNEIKRDFDSNHINDYKSNENKKVRVIMKNNDI